MSNNYEIPVRIFSSESNEQSLSRHPVDSHRYRILLPLPESVLQAEQAVNVQRILRTAVAVANDKQGSVTILGVSNVSDLASLDDGWEENSNSKISSAVEPMRSQIEQLLRSTEGVVPKVPITALIGIGSQADTIIASCANSGSYDGLILLQNRNRNKGLWDSQTVDSVLDLVETAVFIENIEQDEVGSVYITSENQSFVTPISNHSKEISRILLLVGSGPHTVLGSETARALGNAHESQIDALHLVNSESDPIKWQEGRELLDLVEYILGDNLSESVIRETDDVAAEIIQEMENYDITIIGVPTQRPLFERLFSPSVPDKIARNTAKSIIMVRQPSGKMASVYYRWKKAIEKTKENEKQSDVDPDGD